MSTTLYPFAVCGLWSVLLFVGGGMAYFRKGSLGSLLGGGAAGAANAFFAFTFKNAHKARDVGTTQMIANAAVVTNLLLAAMMGFRWFKSEAKPALFVSVASLVVSGVLMVLKP